VERGWVFGDAAPGAVLRHPGGRTIGPDEQVLLAWWTNNASEVHGNADRASRGEFGGPIVLGALSVAIVIGLAAPATAAPHLAARAMTRGWRLIRLLGPVLPGDTVIAESHVDAVFPDEDGLGGTVERSVVGRNQRNEEIVRVDDRCWAPGLEAPRGGPAPGQ